MTSVLFEILNGFSSIWVLMYWHSSPRFCKWLWIWNWSKWIIVVDILTQFWSPSIVRPQLEYASESWNPYNTNTVNRLEQVQRAAARFVYRDYRRTTSVTSLINTLGWDLLHSRRLASQLCMFYKIQNNLANIQFPPVIQPATYFGRHEHQLKYCIPEATVDCYKFSFYPRALRLWNKLPSSAVQAPSLPAFQAVTLPAILQMTPPVGPSYFSHPTYCI